MINHLNCFFVVINENESALIIGSKKNPSFYDDEWYKLVSAQLMIHSFCRSSRDLAFPDKILQGVREEKLQLKDLWIFHKQTITWARDFLMFFFSSLILSFHIIPISADNEFSPLRNYIFKRRNLFIKYVSKYKSRPYMYKYNWKDLKELFPSDFWVILSYFETITRWRFHSRPYARREVFRYFL